MQQSHTEATETEIIDYLVHAPDEPSGCQRFSHTLTIGDLALRVADVFMGMINADEIDDQVQAQIVLDNLWYDALAERDAFVEAAAIYMDEPRDLLTADDLWHALMERYDDGRMDRETLRFRLKHDASILSE